jgi:adenylate kinase
VLFFDLDDGTATARLLGRARDEGRVDDTPEVIARRLALYHEQTEPVVEHYRATGKLVPLHAAGTVGEVFAEIEDALAQVEARA